MMPSFSRAVLAAVALLLLVLVPAVAVPEPGPLPEPRASCSIGPVILPLGGPVSGTCTTTCNSATISVSIFGMDLVSVSGQCSNAFTAPSTVSCGPVLFNCSMSGANSFFPRTLTCVASGNELIFTATCSS